MSSENILANLNSSQKAAVSSTARTLAILAGPGSGKTHTLTSRTAWLLRHEGLQPWNIIVATFTVKAAREMKERIGKLVGDGIESKLVLGTFHSIARRYLARYGHLINIPRDFGIADGSDSLAIIKRIIKRHNLTIDAAAARSRISGRKAKGAEAQPFGNVKHSSTKSLEAQEIETCYNEYEDALKRSNLLDYDDLLLRCVDLLQSYPSCVSNVEAVLIDEFQDTNLVQFDLMRLFASQRKRVTIVGDPDQSIYGFRSAETKNFKRMLKQYPETVTIPLEENYRSSGAILLTALEVIQQDEGRISKSLLPTQNVGTRPVLRRLASVHDEAEWIITEIKRCLTLTGNIMTFDDVAILLRSASLSRHIESELGKSGIPYRMVGESKISLLSSCSSRVTVQIVSLTLAGGHRFFDRVEVKIILDYLRVINQPDNNDALARIVNVPPRRIGEATVKSLIEEADQSSITLWVLILGNARGTKNTQTKLARLTEQGLSSFVNIILTARKKFLESAEPGLSITELIDYIIKKISFEDFLQKNHPDDHEARWANVEELISQASDYSEHIATSYEDDEALPEVEGLLQDAQSNPLSIFLANIALASDVKATEAQAQQAQVTISTIHAAKGLEWPVVFIPAAYEGSIPHSRAEDVDEERRLLYVAMTRAKALLYLSCPLKNSQRERTTLSPFLSLSSLKPFLDEKGPSFTHCLIQSITLILNRPLQLDINPRGLLSREDDLWPLNGEEFDDNVRKWELTDGNPHYTQGQRPPKRQRMDNDSPNMSSRELWQPNNMTTMDKKASFSAHSATIKSGFISAGSHLKVLNEKSINSAAEKATPPIPKGASLKAGKAEEQISQRKPSKVPIPENITSLFTKPNAPKLPRNPPDNISAIRKFPAEEYKNVAQAIGRLSSFAPATISDIGILPSLAKHRLGSAKFSAPNRAMIEEDDVKKKPYVCFSSSPPRAEQFLNVAEETVEAQSIEVSVEESVQVVKRTQPAKTMHTTTMSHINTLAKKSLGVRRDIKGWANRNGHGQGFVVPSMSKRPC